MCVCVDYNYLVILCAANAHKIRACWALNTQVYIYGTCEDLSESRISGSLLVKVKIQYKRSSHSDFARPSCYGPIFGRPL